jgi:hypothetical protein
MWAYAGKWLEGQACHSPKTEQISNFEVTNEYEGEVVCGQTMRQPMT